MPFDSDCMTTYRNPMTGVCEAPPTPGCVERIEADGSLSILCPDEDPSRDYTEDPGIWIAPPYATPEPPPGTCGEGRWYNRVPFFDCEPGYVHPEEGKVGSGVCYCQASPSAMERYNRAREQGDITDKLPGEVGRIIGEIGSGITGMSQQTLIIIGVVVAIILLRR